ncbi:MAG: YgjV family protein [Bdellovibrionales bacterium]|nr:YgjV family protein [Bdellovibrionales bacterium]
MLQLRGSSLSDSTSLFHLSQFLAAAAFGSGILAFQFRERRIILFMWCLAAFMNALHFICLGRFGPAAILLVTATRFLVAISSTEKRLMYLFMTLSLLSFLLTNTHAVGYLALTANLLGTFGTFQPKDAIIRIIFLATSTLWGIHNWISGSPVATLMELTFLLSNGIGLWRFYQGQRIQQFP